MFKTIVLALLVSLPIASSAHAQGGLADKARAGAKTAATVWSTKSLPLGSRIQAVAGIAAAVANPRQKLVDGATPEYFQTARPLKSGGIASRAVMLLKDHSEMFLTHGKSALNEGTDTSHFYPGLKASVYTKRVDVSPGVVTIRTQRDAMDGRPVRGDFYSKGQSGVLENVVRPDINAE